MEIHTINPERRTRTTENALFQQLNIAFNQPKGFEPANPKYCSTEDKEKATANRGIFFQVKLPDKLEFVVLYITILFSF